MKQETTTMALIIVALAAAVMLSSVEVLIPQAHAAGPGQTCKPQVAPGGLQAPPPCAHPPKQR